MINPVKKTKAEWKKKEEERIMGGQGELPEEVTFNAMISQLKSP